VARAIISDPSDRRPAIGFSPNGAWAVAASLGFSFFGFLASRFRVVVYWEDFEPPACGMA